MTLSQIKQWLSERNIRLTKSLGQNFLHDANQVRKIIGLSELSRADKVLEIGPGLGPLTELLVQDAGQVLAIEKDARLVEVLKERFQADESAVLTLLCDDALDFLKREPRDWGGWKLVANLPYSVASPIVVEMAQAPRGPERMVVTLQIEVARRLLAKPDQRDYGVLTLLVGLDYEPLKWFKIPACCFFPEPDVDSACVCLVRRRQPLLEMEEKEVFYKLVKVSFGQRRKMMLKLVKVAWQSAHLDHYFDQCGLAREARAEAVALDQFVRLAQFLQPH